jgi:hypothetical protein
MQDEIRCPRTGDATMVIDANVLYQIAIGNDQVAKALLKRMASGEPVYIATVARRELTVLSPGGK